MIKTNFQPKIGLKQPNALTQRSQPSIRDEKNNPACFRVYSYSDSVPDSSQDTDFVIRIQILILSSILNMTLI